MQLCDFSHLRFFSRVRIVNELCLKAVYTAGNRHRQMNIIQGIVQTVIRSATGRPCGIEPTKRVSNK